MNNESIDELVALVRRLRESALRVEASGPVLETAGAGGDGFKTINLSTLAALVAAAAGVQVAKQNRPAISSYCGSTEVLAELGVAYDLPPEAAADCLRQTGICFLYAPLYHTGGVQTGSGAPLSITGPHRPKAPADRTIADRLLPLANPAGAQHYLVGFGDAELAAAVAQVLRELDCAHALVVHGDDGMDEITCTSTTIIHEVKNGRVDTWTLDPTAYGYLRAPRHGILGGDAVENVLISRAVLAGKRSLYRQYVEINAAAALYAADRVASIEDGTALAKETIDTGAMARKVEEVVDVSRQLKRAAVAAVGGQA